MFPKGTRHERAMIGVLAACGMLSSLQFTLVVPVLPLFPTELGISAGAASWIVTITLLTGTVATPILARLADMYGRRRMFLATLGILAVGSLFAAAGGTFITLLIGRALQGIATAIVPIGISLIRSLGSPERANQGVAFMSATLGIGSAVGLPLSGVLSSTWGIPSLFWFSAVAASVAFVLVFVIVSGAPGRPGGSFDLLGTLVFGAALTALLLVISQGQEWGWTSLRTIAFGAAAVLGFGVWLPIELHHPNPVVDVRRSLSRSVLQLNIASFFASLGMFANHLLTIQEARRPVEAGGLGLSTLDAGLLLVPGAIAMISMAPLAAFLLSRVGARFTLTLGSILIGSSFVFRLIAHNDAWVVGLATIPVGAGTTFAFAAMPTLLMASVPAHQIAAANGLNSLTRALAGAVTSATLALLLSVAPNPVDPRFASDTGLMLAFAVVSVGALIATILALTLPRPVSSDFDQPAERP